MTVKFDEITYKDMGMPRYGRAARTADCLLNLMQEFIPTDRACLRSLREHLMRSLYEANMTLVNVPPEWDHLDKVALEQAMLEQKMTCIMGKG